MKNYYLKNQMLYLFGEEKLTQFRIDPKLRWVYKKNLGLILSCVNFSSYVKIILKRNYN